MRARHGDGGGKRSRQVRIVIQLPPHASKRNRALHVWIFRLKVGATTTRKTLRRKYCRETLCAARMTLRKARMAGHAIIGNATIAALSTILSCFRAHPYPGLASIHGPTFGPKLRSDPNSPVRARSLRAYRSIGRGHSQSRRRAA